MNPYLHLALRPTKRMLGLDGLTIFNLEGAILAHFFIKRILDKVRMGHLRMGHLLHYMNGEVLDHVLFS